MRQQMILQEADVGNAIILSNPPGAAVYIDDLDTGLVTPATINNVLVGAHTYKLSLPEYTDSIGTFDIIYDKIVTVAVSLEPLHMGYLTILSTPSGARVRIDSLDTGAITPVTIGDILEGAHIYQLSLSEYIDNIGIFNIVYDKTTTIDVLLEPVHRGNVTISSAPPEAMVYIDGLDTGTTTPATIVDILVGTHAYRLSLPGYIDKIGTFSIELEKTATVDVSLDAIHKGSVAISSTPPGAKVYIDGLDTTLATPSIIHDLYPGLHAYELELGGYSIYRGSIDIIQDQTLEVQVNLVQMTGDLYFSTNPEGAAIFIDGLDTTLITPATITNMPIGQHTYTLKIGNYNDYTGTINVLEGSTTNVENTLVPRESCISFESSPSGAELIVEGMGNMFVTPVMVCDLPLGKLEYHLRLSGYEPFEGCTTLVPGHGENISNALVVRTGGEEEEGEEQGEEQSERHKEK